jgi:hypothetical protein
MRGLGILTALTQPNLGALCKAISKVHRLADKNFCVDIAPPSPVNFPGYGGYARVAVEAGVRVFETWGNSREFFSTLSPITFGRDIDPVKQPNLSLNSSSRVDALRPQG